LNREQIEDLAKRHDLKWQDRQNDITSLITMIGGHPYLVRLAFYALVTQRITCTQLLAEAPTQIGIYRSHLQSHLVTLQKHPELAEAFKQVIFADRPVKLGTIAAYKLESIGFVNLLGDEVTPSCELYRLYFQERL
jgi:hypothetical protein